MRIAALDLGSNSFHLVVAEARLDKSFTALVTEKAMLRLGDVVARDGAIGRRAGDEAIAVLQRFRAIADSHHVDELSAIGTAALREARDGIVFVDRVRDEVGIDIEVVDGVEEARLIFSAVRSSVLLEEPPALCADLGGGSLELCVGDQGGLTYATSVKVGVARVTTMLGLSDPLSKRDRARLEAHVGDALAPALSEIRALAPKMLVGSSGTFTCLARMAHAAQHGEVPDGINQLKVTRRALATVFEQVTSQPLIHRAKLPGVDPKRAELLPAGAAVLSQLLDGTGLSEMTVSEWALREGMVLEAIGAHDRADLQDDPRAIRRASVLSLCRRSNWRQPHARQVAQLATAIFDQTADLHGLDEVDRELLEHGALLHDVGEHVSRTDHDRHSAYLIENGGLRGFSPTEIRILTTLGRFHIRGTPRPSVSEAFAALDRLDRQRAVALTAILRIADGLDATHSGAVRELAVTTDGDLATFAVRGRGEAELEQWTFRRKKDLFERTFRVECVIDETGEGRASYGAPLVTGLG